MTELTLNIPDEKLPFFILLAKELNVTVIDEKKKRRKLTPGQKEWVGDLQKALHDVDLHMQGKIKLKTAEQLLDEL